MSWEGYFNNEKKQGSILEIWLKDVFPRELNNPDAVGTVTGVYSEVVVILCDESDETYDGKYTTKDIRIVEQVFYFSQIRKVVRNLKKEKIKVKE